MGQVDFLKEAIKKHKKAAKEASVQQKKAFVMAYSARQYLEDKEKLQYHPENDNSDAANVLRNNIKMWESISFFEKMILRIR